MPADQAALVATIERLGIPVVVRSDGPLAILVPSDANWFPDAALRADLVRAAREAGFTNVAVELPGAPDVGA